jgi:hypothetical protein
MAISFGDNVRVATTPLTTALGLSGLTGAVYGETTASVTGVEVVGEVADDYAIDVQLDGRDGSIWFAPELLEFVDHAPGTEIVIGNRRLIRSDPSRASGLRDSRDRPTGCRREGGSPLAQGLRTDFAWVWQIFLARTLTINQDRQGPSLWEYLAMESTPKLSRDEFIERMREKMEAMLGQVADAINEAPPGQIIAGSEEQVRDLFADLRQQAFETGLQMRVNAAEAAFPPSEGSNHRQDQAE